MIVPDPVTTEVTQTVGAFLRAEAATGAVTTPIAITIAVAASMMIFLLTVNLRRRVAFWLIVSGLSTFSRHRPANS
jgi:hypothetical protein